MTVFHSLFHAWSDGTCFSGKPPILHLNHAHYCSSELSPSKGLKVTAQVTTLDLSGVPGAAYPGNLSSPTHSHRRCRVLRCRSNAAIMFPLLTSGATLAPLKKHLGKPAGSEPTKATTTFSRSIRCTTRPDACVVNAADKQGLVVEAT